MLDAFLEKIADRKWILYPAQEEAILEIMSDNNVILNTPTGSGKSLVALAMQFKSLEEGKRSFYTCPIKALVSEKFFDLCGILGPENIGMMTGDATVNSDAPIICCTAEILSQWALRRGSESAIDYIIMDEFHYYSDPERGMAWQIPLLILSKSRFLLMSATLGDPSFIRQVLEELTGQHTAIVSSQERPVPLDYTYRETPIHETLASVKYPVYVVNFTQRECVEQAQNAMSVNVTNKEEKKKIESYFEGFRFDTPFGKDMRRFLSHGIGLHHAGILPKYRLLVEKLAQTGLLKIIMGTDTLGVGVNIPIRTVLFSKLCKFDGVKTSILSVRDFQQIAGRAGRKGFDNAGSVVCQAPEHVIENKRQENRFGADSKLKKKTIKKSAPTVNYVHWDEKTFQKLIDSSPEPLQSRFVVTHGLIMTLLQAHKVHSNQGYHELIKLIARSHETPRNQSRHRKQSALLLKSLIHAGLVSFTINRVKGSYLSVNHALQDNFSLHHTLSLYLLDALSSLDPQDPEHALNVLSLAESIIENPKVILNRQIDRLKAQKMVEMRSEGLEYEERMTELEKIEHPKPLRDFIYGTFNDFSERHPWVGSENIQPKSVVREMFENMSSFNEYVKEYGLERSEGILLRYLSQTYKILVQTVPEEYYTEAILDMIAYLKTLLIQTDSSLIAEWEQMLKIPEPIPGSNQQPAWKLDEKKLKAEVRALLYQLIKALSQQDDEQAQKISEFDYQTALQGKRVLWSPMAKQAQHTRIQKESDLNYRFTQVLVLDNEEEGFIEGLVQTGPQYPNPQIQIQMLEA